MERSEQSGERLAGMDLIRLTGALGVFIYHFATRGGGSWFERHIVAYANGNWGSSFVSLFFILSGALLWHRYGNEELDVPAFYRKRFRAIYPEFWLAFSVCFAMKALREGRFFYKGRPWSLLLSVVGLDGYLLYRIPNYYILGEWFLGAIILLYLLFPLVLRAFHRWGSGCFIILLALCLLIEHTDFFHIEVSRNLIFCTFEFVLGMLLMRERERLQGKVCFALCLVIAIVLTVVPLPFNSAMLAVLLGGTLYVLLGRLGVYLKAHAVHLSHIVTLGAKLSYSAYLTHSVVLSNVLNHWTPDGLVDGVCALLLCLLLTWASAAVLHAISGWLLRRIAAMRPAA